MEGSFKDTGSLGTLFGAIADELERREEMLLGRIACLEKKIGELEERIACLEVSQEPSGENEEYVQVEENEDEYPDEDMIADGAEMAAGGSQEEEEDVTVCMEVAEDEVVEFREEAEEEVGETVESGEIVESEETVLQEELPEEELPEVELEFEFELDDEERPESYREDDDEPVLVLDKVRPDWYDWEVDIPGHYIDDIREGIGLNDKILFMNELFGGSVEVFNDTVDDLNGMRNLVETVEYLRERFPQWDEESDEVYRFYMIVRRRFNKQK